MKAILVAFVVECVALFLLYDQLTSLNHGYAVNFFPLMLAAAVAIVAVMLGNIAVIEHRKWVWLAPIWILPLYLISTTGISTGAVDLPLRAADYQHLVNQPENAAFKAFRRHHVHGKGFRGLSETVFYNGIAVEYGNGAVTAIYDTTPAAAEPPN